ncbi:MAG: PrsW family intramembrane metalloprotease [Spirochaetales bacterium]|nr:PrsW family intramembrane metalloprotease [Leptospiraceae bacterium]MCP5480348.1 PrsW family intramembrane metalloprotease [Spirochaetales bacterium]
MTAGLIVLYAAASVLWLGLALLSPAGLQRRTLLLVFPMGLVAGPVAGAMTGWIEAQTLDGADSGLLRNFLLFLLIVGPIEELAKLLAAFVVVLRRLDFGHAYGGLLIGVAAGLGFACGENVLYLLALGPERTLPRLVLTNLGHAAFSALWGYGLGITLNEDAGYGAFLASLAIAALAHGAYDFLLTLGTPGAVLALALLFIMVAGVLLFLRAEHARHQPRSTFRKRPGR